MSKAISVKKINQQFMEIEAQLYIQLRSDKQLAGYKSNLGNVTATRTRLYEFCERSGDFTKYLNSIKKFQHDLMIINNEVIRILNYSRVDLPNPQINKINEIQRPDQPTKKVKSNPVIEDIPVKHKADYLITPEIKSKQRIEERSQSQVHISSDRDKIVELGISRSGLPQHFISWAEKFVLNCQSTSKMTSGQISRNGKYKNWKFYDINDIFYDYIPPQSALNNKGELKRVFNAYRNLICEEIIRRAYLSRKINNPKDNKGIFSVTRPDGKRYPGVIILDNYFQEKDIYSKKHRPWFEFFQKSSAIQFPTILYRLDPKLSENSMLLKWMANSMNNNLEHEGVEFDVKWYLRRPVLFNFVVANTKKMPNQKFMNFKESFYLRRPQLKTIPKKTVTISEPRKNKKPYTGSGYMVNDVFDYFKNMKVPQRELTWYKNLFWEELCRRAGDYPFYEYADDYGVVCWKGQDGKIKGAEFKLNPNFRHESDWAYQDTIKWMFKDIIGLKEGYKNPQIDHDTVLYGCFEDFLVDKKSHYYYDDNYHNYGDGGYSAPNSSSNANSSDSSRRSRGEIAMEMLEDMAIIAAAEKDLQNPNLRDFDRGATEYILYHRLNKDYDD